MNSINAKGLLVVIVAVVIALYLLQVTQPRSQDTYETRLGSCAQVGVRNHSGVEPYDPFGLCHGNQDDDADLPSDGRRR
jgi:hypothetical protein